MKLPVCAIHILILFFTTTLSFSVNSTPAGWTKDEVPAGQAFTYNGGAPYFEQADAACAARAEVYSQVFVNGGSIIYTQPQAALSPGLGCHYTVVFTTWYGSQSEY